MGTIEKQAREAMARLRAREVTHKAVLDHLKRLHHYAYHGVSITCVELERVIEADERLK